MPQILLFFIFIILNAVNVQTKPLMSDIAQRHNYQNLWRNHSLELTQNNYSNTLENIIQKLEETKAHVMDLKPKGIVYDFKLLLPYALLEEKQEPKTEKRNPEEDADYDDADADDNSKDNDDSEGDEAPPIDEAVPSPDCKQHNNS